MEEHIVQVQENAHFFYAIFLEDGPVLQLNHVFVHGDLALHKV